MTESIEIIDTSSGNPENVEVRTELLHKPDTVASPEAVVPETTAVKPPAEEEKKAVAEPEKGASKRKPKTTTKREVKIKVDPIRVPSPSPEKSVEPTSDKKSPEPKTKAIEKEARFDPEEWRKFNRYSKVAVRQIRGSLESLNRQWMGSRTGR